MQLRLASDQGQAIARLAGIVAQCDEGEQACVLLAILWKRSSCHYTERHALLAAQRLVSTAVGEEDGRVAPQLQPAQMAQRFGSG
ncbi:MAG: hypothetical protein RMK60_02390 [Burkholderiales bacterium]|nr:hypothetical protein [Burkholderiales bacterium]